MSVYITPTTLATTLATTVITATTYFLSIATTMASSRLTSTPGTTTHKPKFRTMETHDLTHDDELLLSDNEQPLTEKTGLPDTDQHVTEQTRYDTIKTDSALPPMETATAEHTNTTTNTNSTTTTYT